MTNEVFSAGNVMTASVQGLKEAQDRLTNVANGVSPNGLRGTLLLATGMVHRYLLGLGADHPPVELRGVLPVRTGRLKNSLFFMVEDNGSGLVGRITSNITYGPVVEARRGFMARTVEDMRGPANDLLQAEVYRVVTRGGDSGYARAG